MRSMRPHTLPRQLVNRVLEPPAVDCGYHSFSFFEAFRSVSQERRCKRGGGYRKQATSYRAVICRQHIGWFDAISGVLASEGEILDEKNKYPALRCGGNINERHAGVSSGGT